MFLFKKGEDLEALVEKAHKANHNIGFVPTMGALHEGHLSLLKHSAAGNELTVCSIFVNPTQFNNANDLARYPRPVEEDIRLLTESGYCDALFLPSVDEMYPNGTEIEKNIDLGVLENIFEGQYRPGHFQGVAHIVSELLLRVKPNRLYMGQKDFQQCKVVARMLTLASSPVALVVCPIRREADGLAMSSRNRLLSESQRTLAGLLYQCLISIQAQQNQKDFATVQKECLDLLKQKNVAPDYVALADADSLEPLSDYDADRKMVALIAATVGSVRLIDNLLL